MIDSFVLAEALSAVIGATVKIQSECSNTDEAIKLDVTGLPTVTFLGYDAYVKSDPVPSLIELLVRLIPLIPLVIWRAIEPPNYRGSSSSDNKDGVDDSSPKPPQQKSDDSSPKPPQQKSDGSSPKPPQQKSDGSSPKKIQQKSDDSSPKPPQQESTSTSLRKVLFVIPDEFFDPGYDFDFTHMSKSDSDSTCTRGGEAYKRPYGWMRFALKVRDKYPDGNAWLGRRGWRNHSVPGEWPVSYHGTSLEGAEGIIKTHYKAGDGEAHGRGIYSSPDVRVADGYTRGKQFTSRNGKTYKVIMQNRINPKKREIKCADYWLVPIPDGTSAAKEKEIVESSIRPYGLLLKEV